MAVWALLSDRSLDRALPALADLSVDLKHEPLTVLSLTHVLQIDALAVFVDAVENPGQAWSVLSELHERQTRLPAIVIVDRDRRIVDVVPVGPRARFASGGNSGGQDSRGQVAAVDHGLRRGLPVFD